MRQENLLSGVGDSNTKASFIDFESKLFFEIEGSVSVVEQAKEWFSDLVNASRNSNLKPSIQNGIDKSAQLQTSSSTARSKHPRSASGKREGYFDHTNQTSFSLDTATLTSIANTVEASSKKKSGEDCLLWIAILLKEQCKKEFFTANEIESVYKQIIGSGVDIAPVRDFAKTLSNMMVPSRNKKWIVSDKNHNYRLSSDGILAINKMRKASEKKMK
jgi:hypothetical protein